MKLFQYDSSSRQSTPDPFSDNGEYGSDNDYDPGYDDNTDSTSTVSDHTKQREKKQLKKRSKDNATRSHGKRNSESSVSSSSDSDDRTEGFSECTDVCDSDDNEDDTNSISAESSDESIFDSRKRKKKGQSSPLGSRYKKPKIASADQSTDTMSLDPEALLNNIENLESSSVQLDPAVLENISIYSHIEGSHSHTNPQIQGAEDDHAAAAAEVNPAPANLRALELDAAAQRHSPGSPAPDPAAAEGNPAHDNLPALDLDVAAQHRSPSSPALDREAVEGNPAPINVSALYLDAAAQRRYPGSPAPDSAAAERNPALDNLPALSALPSSPALNREAVEGNPAPVKLSALYLDATAQRCSPGSPAPDPAAAERNPAPANLSALDLDAVEQRRTPGSPVSDPTAAEENPTPSNLPALDLDAATQCRSPSSSASDREAAEENPSPANLPALDLDATTQCRSPSSSAPPELNATVRYPTPASTLALEVVAERGLSGSPVPERDAAETNSAPTSPSALDREAFVQRNPSICHVLDPEAAERNSVPDTLPEISPATNCRPSTPPLINYDLEHTNTDIPSFEFDESSAGVQFEVNPAMTVMEIFDKILNPNIVDYIVTCINTYGRALCETTRPTTRNSRSYNFRDTNREEILKFFGLCLLMGQIKIPQKRKNFTYSDPLYYHPSLHYVMSARRFEQILRCIYVSDLDSKGKDKIEKFINAITKSFMECYKPYKQLSLDESLLLFRGRLAFRQYIKSKKTQLLELAKKSEKIVLRLMRPYLLKGHQLYMDNYYNSVTLSQKLVDLKTHTTGTLRSNRKDNPKDIIKKKLKKNQHVWVRKNKVYVSKWVDKRPVLMVTTSVHPRLIEIQNRFQQRKIKPAEVAEYNQHMSGVDRADQMISYYSSPRKTIRWYKKVMFHLLDVAVWNSFFIFKKYCQANCDFLLFREELIRRLLDLPADLTAEQVILARSKYDNRIRANLLPLPVSTIDDDVGSSRVHGHWPEKIPVQEGSNKTSKYLKCKMCTKKKVRRETCLRCKGCPEKPALCALCFEEWHKEV
ncbi:unnamed protein product [Parnassius apollo]|uniref:(apollo) hypothetical protein n=1 Tax=Parnassius apollo TaxID=110799 RepID=A0A8S3XX31_PARAO|nr:unnamed protein product [Parnassius apollo]